MSYEPTTSRTEVKRQQRKRVALLIAEAEDGQVISVRQHVANAIDKQCPVTRDDGMVVVADVRQSGVTMCKLHWIVQTVVEREEYEAQSKARFEEIIAAAKKRKALL